MQNARGLPPADHCKPDLRQPRGSELSAGRLDTTVGSVDDHNATSMTRFAAFGFVLRFAVVNVLERVVRKADRKAKFADGLRLQRRRSLRDWARSEGYRHAYYTA